MPPASISVLGGMQHCDMQWPALNLFGAVHHTAPP